MLFRTLRAFTLFLFFFSCLGALAAPNTRENAAWNVNFSKNGSNPAGYYGQWPGHHYAPSPSDWRNVGVYEFITDRFC